MALSKVNLGGTQFYTQRNGTQIRYGMVRSASLALLIENDIQRDALRTMFDGVPVGVIFPDASLISQVIVSPTTIPHQAYTYPLTIEITEVVS